MPVKSGFGTLSIGRDVRADVTLPGGGSLVISNLTDFDAKQESTKLKSKGLDGIVRHGFIPEGWKLTFSVDRADNTIDAYFAAVEAGYYADGNIENCTILETINEADGSVSQYRFRGVALHFDDAGSWKADSYVKMKLSGEASIRERVL